MVVNIGISYGYQWVGRAGRIPVLTGYRGRLVGKVIGGEKYYIKKQNPVHIGRVLSLNKLCVSEHE